jgi:hypothetical protein
MPNISAWPNDASVCSLSQVLVRGSIPQQYYLSSTACAGILRRAEKRGKKVPEPLMRALQAVVSQGQTEPAQTMSSQPKVSAMLNPPTPEEILRWEAVEIVTSDFGQDSREEIQKTDWLLDI